jgi:hypothetical protein
MPHYAITIAPEEAGQEYEVTLRGPGLDSGGRRYIFANTYRCGVFIEAVNFAYEQGRRDALRTRKNQEGEVWIVTGSTPEDVAIRPEGWWAQLKRRWFGRS